MDARSAITLTKADLGHGTRIALQGVDLDVRHGERVLLTGPNGAGKSTLLATLAGLLPPLGGTVRVLGMEPVGERARLHRDIGHLGHADPLYPGLTGRENLALHARLRRLPDRDVQTLLDEVGLAADADRRAAHYSRGMRRRLGVAKALLGKPRLLLLDEPESGLDAAGQELLMALLALPGRTVVVASHRADLLDGSFDRVLAADPHSRRLVEAPPDRRVP